MNYLRYAVFLSVFLVNWHNPWFAVPQPAKLLPDFLVALVTMVIISRVMSRGDFVAQGRYLVFALVLIGLLATSAVANLVQPGAFVQAIRTYLMHVPLFMLPAVYRFDDESIAKLLRVLLLFAAFQLPIAVHQRYILDPDFASGDLIGGTLGNSKTLTMVMLTGVTLLWAFHLKRRLHLVGFAVFALILFVPTTINETTGTLFLLPFALLVPLLAAPVVANRSWYLFTAATIGCLLVILFATMYNSRYASRWGGDVFNVFTEGAFLEYELRGEDESGGSAAEIGRIEAILIPLRMLSKDPIKLLLGEGPGNVQTAPLAVLRGEHTAAYEPLGAVNNTISLLVWETGLIGVATFFGFLYLVWRDGWILRGTDGVGGAMALGWLGVVGMLVVASVYVNVFSDSVLMYLFAFLSGYVAAQRGWVALDARSRWINVTGSIQNAGSKTWKMGPAISHPARTIQR